MSATEWELNRYNEPRPDTSPSRTFPQFPRLPYDLRFKIWELATPGRKLVEVYPRPANRDLENQIIEYSWHATKCACASACHSPLALRHTSQEARQIASRTGKYSWAFDTWVNWSIDIIYIGERVGHLHNAGFLTEVEARGGLEALKTLAIDEEVWMQTCMYHVSYHQFRRCSPYGVLQQLSGLETFILVGRAGEWKDGNEVKLRAEHDKEWIYDDNSEGTPDQYDLEEEDVDVEMEDGAHEDRYEEGTSLRDTAESLSGADAADQDYDQVWERIHERFEEASPSIDPEALVDHWYCSFPRHDLDSPSPRVYEPFKDDNRELRFGPSGHCGLALVDFSKIPNQNPAWTYGDSYTSAEDMLSQFEEDFQNARRPRRQLNDGDEQSFIDWNTWVPPKMQLALCRRTAPSCYVEDWDGLEDDWMDDDEGRFAYQYPGKYAMTLEVRERYPPGLVLQLGYHSIPGGRTGEVRVPTERQMESPQFRRKTRETKGLNWTMGIDY
jgi:hypothetical protein